MLEKHKQSLIFAFWVIAIISMIVGSILPQTALHVNNPYDKLLHFSAYSFIALIPAFTLRTKKQIILVAIFLFIIGSSVEIAQSFVPGRSASYFDGLANAMGIISGSFAGYFLGRFFKKK